MANGGLDGFLQSFFVAAGDVHFGSVALEGLGDDEAEARAAFSKVNHYTISKKHNDGNARNEPPVTTATSPLTSYRSCLLKREVEAMVVYVCNGMNGQ